MNNCKLINENYIHRFEIQQEKQSTTSVLRKNILRL